MSHRSDSRTPLMNAVLTLLNASCYTPEEIAKIAGVKETQAATWFRNTTLPIDRHMSLILRAFEGSKEPVVAEALSQFWDEIRAIEKVGEDSRELAYGDEGLNRLSFSTRIFLFTNDDWMERLLDELKHVDPSRRSACLTAMAEVIDRFATDDQ